MEPSILYADQMNPTLAVDKDGEDQLISSTDWTKVTSARVIWDLLGDYDSENSQITVSQSGIYNYDMQMRFSDLSNVSIIEVALFKVTEAEPDYWFTLAFRNITVQNTVHLGAMTQFDFFEDEEYFLAVKLTPADEEVACSATILGSDDFTAWGASWTAPNDRTA